MLTSGESDAVRFVGPKSAGDEAAPAVRLLRLDRRPTRQARPVAIEFIDELLRSVVGLRDRGRGEGVGLENIRAGHRVSEMDVLDRLRLGQRQQIIVALQVAVAGMKTIAAEMRLIEIQALDLGAHRPVKQQDALARGARERRQRILTGRGRRLEWRD